MDGYYDRANGLAHDETCDYDVLGESNNIRLPDWRYVRARRLKHAIVDAIAAMDFEASCRLRPLGSSTCIDIDEFAAIIIPSGSRDFLFLLRMRRGPRILLSTDDMDMLVDFVRQYAWARIGQDPVLRGFLQ